MTEIIGIKVNFLNFLLVIDIIVEINKIATAIPINVALDPEFKIVHIERREPIVAIII